MVLDSLKLEACDFLKLDIEGMEREAILGARKTIERFKPVLYVENDREERSDALVRTLTDFGYVMYWHHPPLFNPNNYLGQPENIFGNIISKNMICFHESRPHQIQAPRVPVPG